MDIATAKRASALGMPVVYNGIEYERITKRITNVTPGEADTYSLELLDYCGSAVVIAPIGEVEVIGAVEVAAEPSSKLAKPIFGTSPPREGVTRNGEKDYGKL